jgi:hypothetical protein
MLLACSHKDGVLELELTHSNTERTHIIDNTAGVLNS